MATIVNNPGTTENNSGMNMIIGLLILAVMIFLFFIYGLPLIRQASSMQAPQVNVPVPNKVDVNLHQQK